MMSCDWNNDLNLVMMCWICTLDYLNVESLKDICLKVKLKILHGIYMIRCDIIDDNNVALMVDVSNILVTFYQFVWLLAKFLHILFVNVTSPSVK